MCDNKNQGRNFFEFAKAQGNVGISVWCEQFEKYLQKRNPEKLTRILKTKAGYREYLPSIAGYYFFTHFQKAKKHLIEQLRTHPQLISLIKKDKVRASLIGSTFLVLLQNCHGTKMSLAEKFMAELGEFNYEDEIVAGTSGWILPLSGSLFNDTRSNFVAKKIKGLSAEQSINYLENLLEAIIEQVSTAIEDGFSSFANIPYYFSDPEMILNFPDTSTYLHLLLQYTYSDPAQRPKGIGTAQEREIAYSNLINTITSANMGKSEPELLYNRLNVLPTLNGAMFAGNAMTCGYDTRLCPADRAQHGLYTPLVFQQNEAWDEKIMQKFHPKTFSSASNAIDTADELIPAFGFYKQEIQTATILAPLCDRERLEWERQRDEILNRRKAEKQRKTKNDSAEQDAAVLRKKFEELIAQLAARDNEMEELKRQAKKNETKVHHLEVQLDKTKNRLGEAEMQIRTLTDEKGSLEEENKALVSQIFVPDDMVSAADSIDTSVLDGLHIVSYGGFPAWASNMRTLHPNVIIYDAKSPMPETAVDKADIIWLQVNCLDHSTYYKLVDRAKLLNKPIRYFKFAGHGACKRQIVEDVAQWRAGNGV